MGEATSTSEYFGSKGKSKRSEASRPVKTEEPSEDPTAPITPVKANGKASESTPASSKKAPPSTRSSGRKRANVSYAEDKPSKSVGSVGDADDLEEGDDDMEIDEPVAPKRTSNGTGKQKKLKEEDYEPEDDVDMQDTNADEDFVVPDDDEKVVEDKPASKTTAKAASKRKSTVLDDDEELDETPKKKSRKAPAKKDTKKGEVQDSAEIQAIMNDIPLVRAPTPPPKDPDAKFPFTGGPHANSGPPPDSGAWVDPDGAENCLAGLSFVFTGLLKQLGREQGTSLIKRYGGKVTGAPSKKTDFIVLGDGAGPSKLRKIQEFDLKTIDENGLSALISRLPANGGDSKAAAANHEKKEKEEAKIREMAKEMEEQDRRAGGAGGAGATKATAAVPNAKGKEAVPDTRLWTVKYAPQQYSQICGNKGQVEKLQRWLQMFPRNRKTKFKMPGKDGSGLYRAVMIHGPPGIGKTTAAHLAAKMEGYDIVESNASDTRSKKLVESGLKGVLDTRSLQGYFAGEGQKVNEGQKKLVLIMDEVDGMSAGDRGGVGALAAVCKKTEVPMILICNERKQPKMKPFDFCTYDLPFRRPTTDQIRSRIMTILFREQMKLPPNVINALIEGTGADIRQVVNMVSTAKTDSDTMDFDDGKKMSKAWEKHIVLKPWDIVSKILGGGMFSQSSKATLNEKIELYFNDHEFSYLMLQENYLGTSPILANQAPNEKMKRYEALRLASKAAESISDGDLVDRMIHGSQQQWSLMPAHAIFSFVRPASFVSGSQAGSQTRFTSWLGKNSAQGKLTRYIKEIQGHMRLRTSGDRHEVRQQYVPILWQQLVKKLQNEGPAAVEPVMELMDSYFLTKEDFDAIVELGVGPMAEENVKIETQTKSTFTRK